MSGKNSIRLLPSFDASISRHTPKLYPPPPDVNCHSRPANRALLAAGKPETRQYKAVFFLGKSEIGLTSAVVIAIAAP
jgi:hypothetical protein